MPSRRLFPPAAAIPVLLLASLLFAAGCGPHETPRQREVGANWGDPTPTPSAEASAAAGAASDADAFPSIALDIPPPASTPGVDAAETAASKDPRSASAVLKLGYAYYKQAAYSQAADAFAKAALGAPKSPDAPLFEGLARMGAGDLNAAITALDKAATLPGAPAKTASLAYLQIGRCRFQQKRDADAKSAFEESLKLDPRQGGAELGLGTYAAMDKHRAAAKTLFTKAASDLPPGRLRAQALASLGLLAEQSGDKAGAAAAYKKAIKEDAQNGAATKALARLGGR